MIYTLKCHRCSEIEEFFMGADDTDLVVQCPGCGQDMTRRDNRSYMHDIPQIQGDTVSGGCNYDYYDPSLDMHIRGKQHRADEMKKRNLVDFSPDPALKEMRREQRYIKEHAAPGDAEAKESAHAEAKRAAKLRIKRNVDQVFDNA